MISMNFGMKDIVKEFKKSLCIEDEKFLKSIESRIKLVLLNNFNLPKDNSSALYVMMNETKILSGSLRKLEVNRNKIQELLHELEFVITDNANEIAFNMPREESFRSLDAVSQAGVQSLMPWRYVSEADRKEALKDLVSRVGTLREKIIIDYHTQELEKLHTASLLLMGGFAAVAAPLFAALPVPVFPLFHIPNTFSLDAIQPDSDLPKRLWISRWNDLFSGKKPDDISDLYD